MFLLIVLFEDEALAEEGQRRKEGGEKRAKTH